MVENGPTPSLWSDPKFNPLCESGYGRERDWAQHPTPEPLKSGHACQGEKVVIDVENQLFDAELVPLGFYDPGRGRLKMWFRQQKNRVLFQGWQ